MMVKAKRLFRLLKGDGFCFLKEDHATHDIHYVRSHEYLPIFEMIYVVGQGRRGESVYAIAEIW
jgi:hypothetical protein